MNDQMSAVKSEAALARVDRQKVNMRRRRVIKVAISSAVLVLLFVLVGFYRVGNLPLPWWTSAQDVNHWFEAPVPPGWQAYAYISDDGCRDNVDLVPPVSRSTYDPHAIVNRTPEGISLSSATANVPECEKFDPATDQDFTAERQQISIDGAPATLYDENLPAGYMTRAAVATLGGHRFVMMFDSFVAAVDPSSKAAADAANARAQGELQIYMQVLQRFKYTG